MSISYVAAGTLATGTTSASPALPAGIADGDLLIIEAITGHPSDIKPSTPAGWTRIGGFYGGDASAYGSGTGPRRLSLYVRIYQTGDTAPTIEMAAGTNVFIGARMHALHRSAGTGWRYSAAFEDDITVGTSVAITGNDSKTWLAGDFVLQPLVFPSSSISASAEGVNATGVTFGATTERADDAVAVGAGGRLVMSTASVTSVTGSPVVAAEVTATQSGSSYAVGGFMRIREAQAAITATIQNAFPPRVLVAIEGMVTEDIISVTIERSTENELVVLRGSENVDVTNDDALVRIDGEQPFGVNVSYVATLKDVEGDEYVITSNAIITDISHEVLSDPIKGIGVRCQIVSWKELRYERESSVFNVKGRLVVVSGPNPAPQSDLVLFTDASADLNDMRELLDNATNGIIQIRTQASTSCTADEGYDVHAEVDTYLAVIAAVEVRAGRFRRPQRTWRLTVAEVNPWVPELEAIGFTYADVDSHFDGQTYAAFDAEFAGQTYLDVDTFDWGV